MEKKMESTWCAGHTRPWYGKRMERLRGVEKPSGRVTRENVARQGPKMGDVKTTFQGLGIYFHLDLV